MLPIENYNGSDLYAIARNTPFLSKDDEYSLIENVQKNKCQKSAGHLVNANLRLVISISKKYSLNNYSMHDIIHEGVIGLLKAINKFDASKKFRLSSFSVTYISSEIKGFVIDNFGTMRIATTKAHRKIFFNQAKLNKAVSTEDMLALADELNVSIVDIEEFKVKLLSQFTDELIENESDDNRTKVNVPIVEGVKLDSVDMVTKKEVMSLIKDNLNQRERFIIYNRFLSEKPLTRKEIAAYLDIKQQRVDQIEKRVLNKMKVAIEESEQFSKDYFLG